MEDFIKTPNLPAGPVSLAVVDGRIPGDIEGSLTELGIRLIKTSGNKNLMDAVSHHPDMLMHHLGGRDIVVAPDIDDGTLHALEEEGFNIVLGRSFLKKDYPYDTPYNTARIGNSAVCFIKHTDEILLHELCRRNINIIDVKQGYAKCSICIVSSSAIITSDGGIWKKLHDCQIESLLITPGQINLFNMNYGFIGGASGLISHDEIGFFGDLTWHSDYPEIQCFMSKFNKKIKKLSKNPLIDFGTLIPLKEYSILIA